MNYIKKFVIPAVFAVFIIILLAVLRTVPVSKLWKGYSILYVPNGTEPGIVLNTLQENGCKNVISYYNQKVPFKNSVLPVLPSSSIKYISGRNAYFFDEAHNVMLYYIPDEYGRNAEKAAADLIKNHSIDAGLDCKSSFPLVPPVICVCAALFFFIFARHKLVFFAASVFPVLFSFAMPFYTSAASVCIALYAVFLCQKLWRRKEAVKYLLNNYFVLILFIVSVAASFFASFVSGLLFILSLAGSAILLHLINGVCTEREKKMRFRPVLIKPARSVNMMSDSAVKKSFAFEAAIFLLSVFYITSADVFSISNSQDLYFPVPTRYNTESGIPALDDYVVFSWNTLTMPYKSLNESYSEIPEENECITVQRFKNTDEGIRISQETVYRFDSEFRNEVISLIDGLDYPAVEKLMKKQGNDFFVDYSAGQGEKFSRASLILMLILIIIPCGLTIFYLTGRKKHGDFI
ncbi:MAG: hypothetical protein ACI4LX_07240 [Treponema sp.]